MLSVLTEKQRNRLEHDIDILRMRLLAELPQPPHAIFLCGGYGRGEGAWYEDGNGNAMPYNDYDLAVITDYPLTVEKTEILRKEMAREIGIKWIDIAYYSEKMLRTLRPTIHNVDLLSGSKCIYGNENALDVCPHLDATKIGFRDIVILMRIRLWTFLGSWNGDFHDMPIEEARFFKNQMAKATLSLCDLYLIPLKKYTASYQERAKLLCNLYTENTVLCHRVEWAIHEKLHPSSSRLTKEEMEQLYFEVKGLFLKALDYSLSQYGKKSVLSPRRPWKWLVLNTPYVLLLLLGPFWKRAYLTRKSLEIFIAQIYVFFANEEGTVNTLFLENATNILNKWGYLNKGDYDWNYLRTAVADARNNI